MKQFILAILLTFTVVACTNNSSSTQPPAGKDGEKIIGQEKLALDGENSGVMVIPTAGMDLVLATNFPLDPKTHGKIRITEMKTQLETYLEKVKRPLDPATEAQLKVTCFLSSTPHYWVVRHQNEDKHYSSGDLIEYDYNSNLYLIIETRTQPECEKLLFRFKTELIESSTKPEPTPTPSPTPAPVVLEPPGSEALPVIFPSDPPGIRVVYDRGQGKDFTYKMSLLLYGKDFAKDHEVSKIYFNIYDKVNKKYVADWSSVYEMTPATALPEEFDLQFTLDRFSAPMYLIDRQKEMIFTFAVNAPDNSVLPIRSLNMGDVCNSIYYSTAIVDKNGGRFGCP